MRKILITGGSGFIGSRAVRFFRQKGFLVKNLDIRRPSVEEEVSSFEFCDINNFDSFRSIFVDFEPDFVLHLAADLGMGDVPIEEFKTNIIGVENLVRILNEFDFVERVIFTSSLLVCSNGYVPKDFDEYCAPNNYGQSKVIGEKTVKENMARGNWVIVRPTSVWGPGFQYSYRKFFKAISRGIYFQPGENSPVKPICFVDNLVYMLFRLFECPSAVEGGFFYLLDYPEATTRDWSDAIRRCLGKPGSSPVVPIWLLRLPAWVGDALIFFGVRDPIFSSFRLRNMLSGGSYPVDELRKFVGELPYDLEAGVLETVRWLRSVGDIK